MDFSGKFNQFRLVFSVVLKVDVEPRSKKESVFSRHLNHVKWE